MKLERTTYGDGHPVAVFYPDNLPALPGNARGFRVTLFLHGLGAVGNDIDKMIADAELAKMLPGYQSDIDIFVCPVTPSNWKNTTIQQAVVDFLNQKLNGALAYFLTGISLGGIGCYAFMARFPYFFNIAGVIAGRNEGYTIPIDARAAIRAWHGDLDNTVNYADGQRSIADLEKAGYLNEHTFVPIANHGHGIWNIVYHNYYFPWVEEKNTLANPGIPSDPADPGTGALQIEYDGIKNGAVFEFRKPSGQWVQTTADSLDLDMVYDRIRLVVPNIEDVYKAKIDILENGAVIDSVSNAQLRHGGKLVLYNADVVLAPGQAVRFTIEQVS